MSIRLNGAIGIMALLIMVFGAQMAFGNPVDTKRLYVANDNVQDTIVASSGSYDPCCDYMTWADTFHVVNHNYSYSLKCDYHGTSVYNTYDVNDYPSGGTYTFTNQVYVGPSTSHELIIKKSSIIPRGCFSNIIMRAYYDDGTPGRPSGH